MFIWWVLGVFLLLCLGVLAILLTCMVVGLVILPLLHVHLWQLKWFRLVYSLLCLLVQWLCMGVLGFLFKCMVVGLVV